MTFILPLISPIDLGPSIKSFIWVGIVSAICLVSSAPPCWASLGKEGTIIGLFFFLMMLNHQASHSS